MNETDPAVPAAAPQDVKETTTLAPRRGPDALSLLAGLGALGVAGPALLSGVTWLPDVDGRWVLAALALLVGLLLVISSLRSPHR